MKEKINQGIDKLFERPIIGILVAIIAFYIPIFLIGKLGTTFVGEYAIRIVATAVYAGFVYWLRGDRMYSCGFKKYGAKGFLCILPIILLAIVSVTAQLVKNPDRPAIALLYTAILAFEAGFFEEIMVRAIPLGNTVWKQDNFKGIIRLAIISSVIFGFLHMGNVFRTGSLTQGLSQSIGACFAGVFFAAVYLRTGSIIPGIVAHFLWDFMTMLVTNQYANGDMTVYSKAADTTNLPAEAKVALVVMGVGFIAVEAIFMLVCTLILLRKSKRNEIMENFAK